MDLHIYYRHRFKLNDKVQGFNVLFDPSTSDFEKMLEFIQAFPEHEINIKYKSGVDEKTAGAFAALGGNVRTCLEGQDIQKVGALKKRGCKFYFDKACGVSSYWELKYMVEDLGVDSVYILDDLCYNLEEVSAYCRKHNVRLRVVLNRCPSKIVHNDKRLMFYRPQDMGYLERYYDIAEFECGEGFNDFNEGLCEVLYKRFFVNTDWYGNVRDLNPSIPFNVYNRQLPLPYVHRRSNCKLQCLQGNKDCTFCESMYDLMGFMFEHDAQFDIKPRQKDENAG